MKRAPQVVLCVQTNHQSSKRRRLKTKTRSFVKAGQGGISSGWGFVPRAHHAPLTGSNVPHVPASSSRPAAPGVSEMVGQSGTVFLPSRSIRSKGTRPFAKGAPPVPRFLPSDFRSCLTASRRISTHCCRSTALRRASKSNGHSTPRVTRRWARSDRSDRRGLSYPERSGGPSRTRRGD